LDGVFQKGHRAGGGASLGEVTLDIGDLTAGTHFLQLIRGSRLRQRIPSVDHGRYFHSLRRPLPRPTRRITHSVFTGTPGYRPRCSGNP